MKSKSKRIDKKYMLSLFEKETMSRQLDKDIKKHALHLIELGLVTESHLTDYEKLWSSVVSGIFIKKTKDHKNDVLKQARLFFKKKQYNFCLVFYAIYFEHTINRFYYLLGSRYKLDVNEIIQILRLTPLEDKLKEKTLRRFGVHAPRFEFKTLVKSLVDKRNYFVHYKWNDRSEDRTLKEIYKSPKEIENEYNNLFSRTEKAIKYFKTYETKVLFGGKKRIFKEKINNLGFKVIVKNVVKKTAYKGME